MKSAKQKVESVPSCAADNDALANLSEGKLPEGVAGSFKPNSTEVNRRACTSAAMIGLAISMGASSLLLPGQGDEATLAAEPVAAEPTSATVPAASENTAIVTPSTKVDREAGVVSSSTKVEPQAGRSTTPPTVEPSLAATIEAAPRVIEHKVKPGQTLWHVSQKYQVDAAAIAASNDHVSTSSILPSGKVLKVPSVNGIVHKVKAGDTVETISKSYGVTPAELQPSAQTTASGSLPVGESIAIPGNVNNLLKARQETALNRLKEQRDRLHNSLAELKSEESRNTSELAKVPNGSSAVAEGGQTAAVPPAAVEAEVPMITAPQQVGIVASPGINPVASPATPAASPVVIPPKAATLPIPAQSPVASPATPAASPVVIPPKAATVPIPAQSPVASPATPAASPVVIPPKAATIPTPTLSPVASPATPAASPVVIPPKAATAPTPVQSPAKTPTASEALLVPAPVVIEPQVAESADLYQVKPGDTLDAIALSLGVSPSELIRENQIENPNLIRVRQKLRIPQTHSVTLVRGLNQTSGTRAPGRSQPSVSVPSLAIPSLPTAVTPAASKEAVLRPKMGTANSTIASSVVGTAVPTSTVFVASEIAGEGNSKPEDKNNPYIEKLRDEIVKLREQYRVKTEASQAKPGANATVSTIKLQVPPPEVKPSVAAALNNKASAPATPINSEFIPRQYNAIQFDNQRQSRKQPLEQGPIEIKVPLPETPNRRRQQSVATASPGAGNYNPALVPRIGQPVAPELPPLDPSEGYPSDSSHPYHGYIWPTKGVLTSGYGWRWGRMHKGIDIAAPIGTPVVAAAPGVVVYARWNSGGYGNLVDIQHPDGTLTRYGHNHRILVREGQFVEQGQQISEMGSTGYSTGPHCHFEVHPPGKGAVNPIAFLPRR